MENQQMAMPAEMAPTGPNPEEMAVYEQMRQQISPQEFSNEMLASASQIDPQAVAEFTEELRSLDVSPEELDALNDLVDEILANPEQYEELRQKYLAQGLPEDILPEQFDPNFFAAMNMAVDQMIAAPTGVQAFAEGGIAELKPIAKAIASYGRNGDTMLAHITPAEARMLRRRGGSGTINPHTGLPEFFLKKAFKSIGNAVKKFASSTVGRLVTTVALGFFLGPAAASVMGVGAGTAAGMAISGFVGGAGSTLLAGGNLKDALKAGAIGGLTAGVAQGLSGAPLTGPATMTPGQALQGRVDQFTGMLKPGAAVQAPTPGAGAGPQGIGPNQAAVPPAGGPQFDVGDPGAGFEPMGGGAKPTLFDQGKKFVNENISPSGIRQQALPGAQQAAADAVAAAEKTIPASITGEARAAMLKSTYDSALKGAMPGIMGTYGPMAAVGLGAVGAFGGFQSKPVEGGDITKSLMKSSQQRMREEGTQRLNYLQNLPGVVYDRFGEPIAGQNTRFPTYDVPDYDFGGFGSFGSPTGQSQNQGIMNLPSVYIPPAGTIGSRRVEQPYNNANMYSNLIPRGYSSGGAASADNPPSPNDTKSPAEEERLATERLANQQRAARDLANQKRAQRRAAGSGQMYGNINAGLAALAPETNPMDTADTGFGARNRAARTAELQRTYAPMLQGQRFAMDQQAGIAASGQLPRDISGYSGQDKAEMYRGLARQGMTDPQIRAAAENRYGMQTDSDWGYLQKAVGDTSLYTQRPGEMRDMEYRPGRDYGPRTGMPMTPPAQPVTPPVSRPPVQPPAQVPANAEQLAQAAQLGVTLPANWGNFNPQEKINFFNQQGTTPAQLEQSGVSPSDIAWMQGQGYTVGVNDDSLPITTMPVTPPPPGSSFNGSPITTMPSAAPATAAQNAQATQMGLGSLPPNWGNFNPQEKISFFNEQGVTPDRLAQSGVSPSDISWMQSQGYTGTRLMNMGGIAALNAGGYPRRTGQISGPGTEKSDSIPAMLSDGEFVMTAKAVRGAGKGSRRAGAKQMYKLMHQLEKNSERG